ncbi:uncharacterized protein FSUBG_12841 [Fusarium subglutinans]|uniref:Uncharacterized protein n=1 Tax=Gibberella subglutinans TaxID=42677 RepID=A0A8H5NZK7_GIBSU|nr:uncharacterized protein FSUBG_12841 [Fusarium subglutinans]KAF5584274.1 hypothetical protein FSUBG_12841 [Fusarium subglutinans]
MTETIEGYYQSPEFTSQDMFDLLECPLDHFKRLGHLREEERYPVMKAALFTLWATSPYRDHERHDRDGEQLEAEKAKASSAEQTEKFTLEDLNQTLILMYITIDYRARGGTSAKNTKVLIDKNPSGTFQTLHEPVPEIHWVTSILSSQEEEKAAWPPTGSSGQRDDDEGDLVMVLIEPNSTNLVPAVLIRESGTVKGNPEWQSDKDVLNHPKVKPVFTAISGSPQSIAAPR